MISPAEVLLLQLWGSIRETVVDPMFDQTMLPPFSSLVAYVQVHDLVVRNSCVTNFLLCNSFSHCMAIHDFRVSDLAKRDVQNHAIMCSA
jgi:hypothetical protein